MPGPLLAAIAATALQPAAPAPPPLAGTWQGTIGGRAVRACFVQRDWGAFGAYYDMARLRLIPLTAEEGTGSGFSEGGGDAGTPRWQIVHAGPTRLTARRTSGRRTLPVQLRRLSGPQGEESPCAGVAFHRPRLAGIGTVTARVTYSGVDHDRLTLDTGGRFGIEVVTFALDGASPAIRRINAALAAPLAGDPPRWFECVSNSLQQGAMEGEYSEKLEMVTMTRRWLSVRYQQGGYCGGAHPDASSSYRLFDLTTGAEVNIQDWFNDRAIRRERVEGVSEEVRTLQPAFRAFLTESWQPQDAECGEPIRTAEYWNIGLEGDGFLFGPQLPHALAACYQEWGPGVDMLAPWLTPEALAQMRALRAERP